MFSTKTIRKKNKARSNQKSLKYWVEFESSSKSQKFWSRVRDPEKP